MTASILEDAPDFISWTWEDLEPRYSQLESREITANTIDEFLRDWSDLSDQVSEIRARLFIATTQDSTDEDAKRRFNAFLEGIFPHVEAAQQRLREKLLNSSLEPRGLEVPLRRLRMDVELYRDENVPLEAEEQKLSERYLSITGSQTVEWDGETISLTKLSVVQEETARGRRERAWRLARERMAQDRDAVDEIWKELLALRVQEAKNAGFDDYTSYRWKQLKRFDYTPENAKELHAAVEEVVVPVVARLYEKRRQRLGVETLRPWDLRVDPSGRPPLHPFDDTTELIGGISTIFHRLDPVLGEYIDTMSREGLLDLAPRINKAPVGYCYPLESSHRPFIFFEAVGKRLDVETLLHEGGHAAHVFESGALPYHLQRDLMSIPMEFVEVGSMAMEFLGEPYLTNEAAGFYSQEDAARARLDHIEQRVLAMWGSLALGDAFQHWIYAHPDQAAEPSGMDNAWMELNRRFEPVVDWSDLGEERKLTWRAIPHFFEAPFYLIEYALAQLAAVQIAANARKDERDAVQRYRHALSLGGTKPLPDLYAAAGARFAFNAETFRSAMSYLEATMDELERQAA